jgi:2-methylcitrate dehydratase PrpD
VCGAVGSAVAAAAVLGLDTAASRRAAGLAMLQSAGLLGAFGSDGKALQVGMAAAAGVRSALLARAGATVPPDVVRGFEAAYGATWADPDEAAPAIAENWIKAYPCCLQTHSAIEAADLARVAGSADSAVRVTVHPLSLRAAPYALPADELEAKFSIPYTVAFTLLHGPPGVPEFRGLDDSAMRLAAVVEVASDPELAQSEAVLEAADGSAFRVAAALGSPDRPMTPEQLRAKVRSLTSTDLEGLVADDVPARDVLEAVLRLA